VVNVLLVLRLLQRLLTGPHATLAYGGCALFAIHWMASEAASYISGLGVLWSMLGALVSCHGVTRLARGCQGAGIVLIVSGLIVALAGGEYGVAAVPLILACAVWPYPSATPVARERRGLAVAGLVFPVAGLYVGAELLYANRGRVGHEFTFGMHIPRQLADNLARLSFPSPWIGMDACFVLLLLAVLGTVVSRQRREGLWTGPFPLLLLASVAALLPFAPSLQGNYGRFLYLAAPFFCCWLLRLVTLWLGSDGVGAGWQRRWTGALAVLVLVNLVHLEKRIASDCRDGEPVRGLIQQVRAVRAENPDRRLRLWADQHSYYLDLFARDDTTYASPEGPPPANELWLIIAFRSPGGLGTAWITGEAVDQAPGPSHGESGPDPIGSGH
jgi:hypothetical protein